MKKRELVDLVKSSAKQIDRQNTYDFNRVASCLGRAINDVWFQIFKQDASNYDIYTKPYTVSINRTNPSEPFVTLPVPIVQLQFVGDGIRGILPTNSQKFTFQAVSHDTLTLYTGTPLNNLDDSIPFALLGNNIYFGENLPTDVTSIRLLLVRPFEAYALDEEFPLPSGQDINILTRALQFLGLRQPDNLVNNNTEWQKQPSQQ